MRAPWEQPRYARLEFLGALRRIDGRILPDLTRAEEAIDVAMTALENIRDTGEAEGRAIAYRAWAELVGGKVG